MFEGDKFYLGRLEVQGNTQTRDKVIRREFALDEGDVMNMEAVKKSVQKIEALGYFKMGEEPGFSVRAEEKKVDVVDQGAGDLAQRGPVRRRLLGVRRLLRAVLVPDAQLPGPRRDHRRVGADRQGLELRRPLVHGALVHGPQPDGRASRSTAARSTTSRSTSCGEGGSACSTPRGSALFDSASLLYSYENIKANFPVRSAQTPPGQPPPPQKFTETTGKTSALTPAYRYDSRNDPFDPNAGLPLYASVQVAPKLLGSGNALHQAARSASTIYIPVPFPRRAVLALNFEAGYIQPISGSELPIFERFQLGGEQSLRGFQQGAVVPVHPKTYQVFTDEFRRILGGNKFFVINMEYQFVQVGPAKLLAFMDVGNNFHETQSFSFDNIRTSAGMELRVFLPIFQAPLRFIYAFNLHPIQPIDQFGFPIDYLKEKKSGFTFSIGRTF